MSGRRWPILHWWGLKVGAGSAPRCSSRVSGYSTATRAVVTHIQTFVRQLPEATRFTRDNVLQALKGILPC